MLILNVVVVELVDRAFNLDFGINLGTVNIVDE